MDLEFIKHHLEGIKKQHDMVKDQETYVITSMTVNFLVNSLENVVNEYETVRKENDMLCAFKFHAVSTMSAKQLDKVLLEIVKIKGKRDPDRDPNPSFKEDKFA